MSTSNDDAAAAAAALPPPAKKQKKASSGHNTSADKSSNTNDGNNDDSIIDDNAESNNSKSKRKKVSKACIFCKRSHMTCTDTRPCERCIKRDIAHLCQDGPISGVKPSGGGGGDSNSNKASASKAASSSSAAAATANTASSITSKTPGTDKTNASIELPHELSIDPSPSLNSLPSSQLYQQQEDGSTAPTSAFARPSYPHSQSSNTSLSIGPPLSAPLPLNDDDSNNSNHYNNNVRHHQHHHQERDRRLSQTTQSAPVSTASLLFGHTLDELSPNPPYDSSNKRSHAGSLSQQHQQSHSQSPVYGTQNNNNNIQQFLNDNSLQQQQQNTSSNNNQGATTSTSAQQPQQTRPWNPFDVLNQAYNYQYPAANNANNFNNSLASLRLFATTADAQFGKSNLGGGSNMGLLNNGGAIGSAASENGSNSEIDSTALDEFLKSLDEMYLNPSPDLPQQTPIATTSALATLPGGQTQTQAQTQTIGVQPDEGGNPAIRTDTLVSNSTAPSRSISPVLGAGHVAPATSTERFLLTAADQKEGTRDERLNRVIRAKYDAGLLRPFNYIKGYERLNTWMDRKWTSSGKHRTLRIISEFRPHFRNIAQSLTDLDLVFIEEAFERLLLDYDRVWRRTGEIFKGNREFAELVGIPYEQLRDGKLAIYELMSEDSAVNFWEKYGSIAFDPAQKAVLTSCVLVDQRKLKALREDEQSIIPPLKSTSTTSSTKDFVIPAPSFSPNNIPEEAMLTCTFSFTIRRDAYHIPNAIVGNFMPYDPSQVRV